MNMRYLHEKKTKENWPVGTQTVSSASHIDLNYEEGLKYCILKN